jgi:hypothetical protein
MCRSIKPLNNFEPPVTDDEVHAAALQYVRKISGTAKPAAANSDVFEAAVQAVAAASRVLLDSLVTTAPPKNREVEAAKARARAQARYS